MWSRLALCASLVYLSIDYIRTDIIFPRELWTSITAIPNLRELAIGLYTGASIQFVIHHPKLLKLTIRDTIIARNVSINCPELMILKLRKVCIWPNQRTTHPMPKLNKLILNRVSNAGGSDGLDIPFVGQTPELTSLAIIACPSINVNHPISNLKTLFTSTICFYAQRDLPGLTTLVIMDNSIFRHSSNTLKKFVICSDDSVNFTAYEIQYPNAVIEQRPMDAFFDAINEM